MHSESGALLFCSTLALAFWTVLVAELVGDKSMYTLSSLALRFRAIVILTSLALAAAGKMAAAVLFASIIFRFHSRWIGILSAVAFFISAILIWYEEPAAPAGLPTNLGWRKAALACFASLFLTEWCDPGQISAAALALRSHSLLPVWLGGTFALISKGGLAMTLGVKLRDRLPHRMLRPLACTSCCILGVVTLGKLFVK
ncbi:MAG TPA: TMEM165/GDT1 family protein [Candidatus Angelobacter sp.]|nr:TMEM165/GDT1 family protein [Candidatus Angelobacter sp.]